MVEGIDAWFKGEAPRNWPNHPHTVPSSLCNGFAVIAGGASRLRRASEDAGERWMWPSFEARKSAHLSGERNCVHPGDDVRIRCETYRTVTGAGRKVGPVATAFPGCCAT